MNTLTPLQIRKISEIIALPSGMSNDPNYLSGQKLVDFFNTFGFGDDYRYPSIGIVTKDIGESLSRQKYAFERINKLSQMGKMPEAINQFLQSVREPLEVQRKFQEILQQSVPHIDLSAYKNHYASTTYATNTPTKTEYTQFEDITESDIVVFISYAWDDAEHKKWVRKLSDDLRHNGIKTLLDDYNPGGVNLIDFMRKGIKLAQKVLVIGSPRYKEKVDAGSPSGVNFEDQILTIDLYNGIKEKYIPVLRKGTFQSSFSELMSVQSGYDFTDDSKYDELLKKLIADLSGHPLNAAPRVGKLPEYVSSSIPVESPKWKELFHYTTLKPEELEEAYEEALEIITTPDKLTLTELSQLVFVLCKIDNEGVKLSEESFEDIQKAFEAKFEDAVSFDELYDLKIRYYHAVGYCGAEHVDYASFNKVSSFVRSLIERLEKEKKWLLVLCLEHLSEENSGRIIDLLEKAPDTGRQYSSLPIFDKVDIDVMYDSLIHATPKAISNLGKFLIERYKLVYPLTLDNDSLEFKEDIENLSILLTRLTAYVESLKPIARLSYVNLMEKIEKSIMRCEGDRNALIH